MKQQKFFGLGITIEEKSEHAIKLLQMHEENALDHCEDGYHLAFSGGKDSVLIYDLVKRSGVKFKAYYNVTTIDPPELVYFIRKHYPEVVFLRPEKNFFTKFVEKGYPTRLARWCCDLYKERSGSGKFKVLGVRAAESAARANNWKFVTRWEPRGRAGVLPGWCLCPALKFTDDNVWEYIREHKLDYCSLYDEGFKRLGCIGCPMGGTKNMAKEFERWPNFKKKYLEAFRLLWERKKGTVLTRGRNRGEQWPCLNGIDTYEKLFELWMSGKAAPKTDEACTMGLF